jgi:hypothetical protein
MKLDINSIYFVVDNNFDHYSEEIFNGCYTDMEEANKVSEELNLKHFLEIEKSGDKDTTTRYSVMTIKDVIKFVNDIKDNQNDSKKP